MGLFSSKINREVKKLERGESVLNLNKQSSDKAVDVIRELSGVNTRRKKLIDKVIVFTNASGGTGATTTLINVAYNMVQQGLKVCAIDLNIMCPTLHAYLGIEQNIDKNTPDLVGYLLGKNKLNESINVSDPINLLYSNNRTITDEVNCNTKIAIENFGAMISSLREYYDVILVDCPMRIDCLLQNTMFYLADAIYTVWDEGINCILNTEKVRRNMAMTGIEAFTKMRVILNKRTGVHYSKYPMTQLNLELVEVLPYEQDIVYDSLRGAIFCKNGSSSSDTAKVYTAKIVELTDKILKIAGYVK